MGKLSKEESFKNLTDLIKLSKVLLKLSNSKSKKSQSGQESYLSKLNFF